MNGSHKIAGISLPIVAIGVVLIVPACMPSPSQPDGTSGAPPPGKSEGLLQNTPSPDSPANRYEEIRAVLENAVANKQYESEYDDLTRSPYLRDVIAAIAAVDPVKGLSLLDDLDSVYRGDALPDFKAATASALARVLEGTEKRKLFEACQESNEPGVVLSLLFSARISSPEELKMLVDLAEPTTLEGSLALLLAAVDLKDGGGNWETALQMAQYQKEGDLTSNPLATAHEVFRAYLAQDIEPLRGLLEELSTESTTERQILTTVTGISIPLGLMLARRTPETPDHRVRYANYVCEASKSMQDEAAAFTVLALATEALGERPPDCIATQLKERWRKASLNGEVTVGKHGAAFFAFNAMLDSDEHWATTVAEELVNSLLARENSETYYHMVGTIVGILAGRNPSRAREIAKQVRSLEWHVNALRCIYREWAKVDPEAALKAAKKEDFGMNDERNRRLCADITLEAAVGAALLKPSLAADEIALLPDNRVRLTQGYCLIAPLLARQDLNRALTLILPAQDEPIIADVATALAHILLEYAVIDIDPALPDFFPDYLRPRNSWPGPRLSQPIRF